MSSVGKQFVDALALTAKSSY